MNSFCFSFEFSTLNSIFSQEWDFLLDPMHQSATVCLVAVFFRSLQQTSDRMSAIDRCQWTVDGAFSMADLSLFLLHRHCLRSWQGRPDLWTSLVCGTSVLRNWWLTGLATHCLQSYRRGTNLHLSKIWQKHVCQTLEIVPTNVSAPWQMCHYDSVARCRGPGRASSPRLLGYKVCALTTRQRNATGPSTTAIAFCQCASTLSS